MNKVTGPIFCSIVLYLMVFPSLLLLAGDAKGDGVAFNTHVFDYSQENYQVALIDHTDGMQRMTIAVDIEGAEAGSTLWILPVPSTPNDINISIESSIPSMMGESIDEEFQDDRSNYLSDLYCLYFGSIIIFGRPITYMVVSDPYTDTEAGGSGVNVHQKLDQHGMHIELISSETGAGIYDYLNGKGLSIDSGNIPQLDDYVEEGYSFAASWITNTSELGTRPGIYIEFPTERIYYPMALTSVYEDRKIPITLMVMGHAIPDLNEEIEDDTYIEYFKNGDLPDPGEYGYAINGSRFQDEAFPNFNGKFTVIEIESEASNYKEDIWMEEGKPEVLKRMDRLEMLFFITIGFVFLIGLITSTILSFILFKENKRALVIYSMMGLLNPIAIWIFVLFSFVMKPLAKVKFSKLIIYISIFQVINAVLFILFVQISFGSV